MPTAKRTFGMLLYGLFGMPRGFGGAVFLRLQRPDGRERTWGVECSSWCFCWERMLLARYFLLSQTMRALGNAVCKSA
jgi:hypothetical protein